MRPNGPVQELLVSPETVEKLYDIHTLLKEMHPMCMEIPKAMTILTSMSVAMTSMSEAARIMADTDARRETRILRIEDRLQEAYDKTSGKGFVPLLSHFASLAAVVLFASLVILWQSKQNLEASTTSIKINQAP